MSDKKDNVIPLRRKAETPRSKLQDTLSRINKTMDELKQMAADQRSTFPSEAIVNHVEQVRPSTLPSDEELEREYRRKKDEAKKKREQNNKNVTRDYRLTSKRTDPSYDK